jgi:5-hydroxyisourate hydrolase
MVTISTHTLDSATGAHAANVEVCLYGVDLNSNLTKLWSKKTDQGGRLSVEFKTDPTVFTNHYQLSFKIKNYFTHISKGAQVSSINLSVVLPDPNGFYHLPIIISPYGASLWWSN